MQYLLMLYADEAGWSNMSKSEQEQGMAAYMAYREALKAAGALQGFEPAAANLNSNHGAQRQRQVAGAGWPLRGFEGAAGRLLFDRRTRSGCRSLLGGSLPRRRPWGGRSSPDLEHA